ncbi:MAG: right-handed parallel beta-helix repeat-containing protein [Pseudomonadales bacterium]|nr:right-handed parallel beta-helix repeat-containing protein [Halioglobus sp.]MCP5122001.1 right-handed parallel beta-helix repeat-containing protein [Pseudomonadales bacterium]MCP5191338.1 right-handed parallel beta-helix repeat-containing protein [Pseudomonadales bacterium]MCP5192460.1 right-handed parallel beta-helix repeat-containing protein [Pseudomonadales bacterium]
MKRHPLLCLVLALLSPHAPAAVHTVSAGQSILAAVKQSAPGDTVRVMPGTYVETVYIDRDNITLQGVMVGGERPVLDGRNTLKDGILVAGDGVTVEHFLIRNYTANGLNLQGVNNFVVRHNIVQDTGIYAINPELSRNGLVAYNRISGVWDAAIYCGECMDVDILYNEAFGSVMGIESQTSQNVLIEGNYVHDNATGIAAFLIPGVSRKTTGNTVIRNNFVVHNNRANFAPPDSMPGLVPEGVGIAIAGYDEVTLEGNQINGNQSAGILLVDQATAFGSNFALDPAQDPTVNSARIYSNMLFGNGGEPLGLVAAYLADSGLPRGPDILDADPTSAGNCIYSKEAWFAVGVDHWSLCAQPTATAVASMRLAAPIAPRTWSDDQLGRNTWVAVCSACHNENGYLIGPPVARIQQDFVGAPEALAAWIAAPTRMNADFPPMPPQDYLPEKTRLAVARHVLGLQPKAAANTPPTAGSNVDESGN